jgi:hypothetical protein
MQMVILRYADPAKLHFSVCLNLDTAIANLFSPTSYFWRIRLPVMMLDSVPRALPVENAVSSELTPMTY